MNTSLPLSMGIAVCLALASTAASAQRAPGAPQARIDNLTEQHHGETVADPYRYMEDTKRPDVLGWMREQSGATADLMASIDGRDAIAARIQELTSLAGDRITGLMRLPGERYYYQKRARGERQYRLVMRQGLNGAERTLVDPEVEGRATGVPHAINYFKPSWDGRYVAFGISAGGSEDATLHVLDVRRGQRVGEPLPRVVSHSAIHWLPDSRSFTANQLQALQPGQPETDHYKNSRVLWQRVGARAAEARPVFGPTVTPALKLDAIDNGEILTVPGSPWMVASTTDTTEPEGNLFVAPLAQLGKPDVRWQRIASAADKITQVELRGHELFVLTHAGAPRHKLVRIDLRRPDLARAVEIVPEPASGMLQKFQLARSGVLVQRREGTALSLWLHGAGDRVGRAVPRPHDGAGLGGGRAHADRRCGAVLHERVDTLATVLPGAWQPDHARELRRRAERAAAGPAGHRSRGAEPRRREGADDGVAQEGPGVERQQPGAGARLRQLRAVAVGLLLTRQRGVAGTRRRAGFHQSARQRRARQGVAPRRLQGQQAQHLERRHRLRALADRTTLRLTGHDGHHRHQRGRHLRRPRGHRSARVVRGGDLQRGRARCDPRRSTAPTAPPTLGEFGSVANRDEFHALMAMSTYHQIRDGTAYPAVMLVHGVNDPRVPVWESNKTAARLQAASSSGKPVLLRLDTQAGHGMGSTLTQRTSAVADQYAFMLWQMGKLNKKRD